MNRATEHDEVQSMLLRYLQLSEISGRPSMSGDDAELLDRVSEHIKGCQECRLDLVHAAHYGMSSDQLTAVRMPNLLPPGFKPTAAPQGPREVMVDKGTSVAMVVNRENKSKHTLRPSVSALSWSPMAAAANGESAGSLRLIDGQFSLEL